MLATFVIGFHTARIDNLLQTLRFLIKDHTDVVKESYLEAVCQDDCEEHLPYGLSYALDEIRESFRGSCITNLNLNEMMLPYVTNLGVEGRRSEKIIVLESDRILPAGYFKSVIEQLQEGIQITCRSMKKLTKPATDEEIASGNFEYKNESRDEKNSIGVRNMWSGNTAFCAADYYKAGRMDEAYIGYGWADSDMTNAMAAAGVQSVYREEIELHLWHPPATYGSGDQKQLFINNGLRFCKKWGQPLPDWFRAEIAQHRKVMI